MKTFATALILLTVTLLLLPCAPANSQPVKNNFVPGTPKLGSDLMTPEVLWSFGRVGAEQVSPDGKKVLYDGLISISPKTNLTAIFT